MRGDVPVYLNLPDEGVTLLAPMSCSNDADDAKANLLGLPEKHEGGLERMNKMTLTVPAKDEWALVMRTASGGAATAGCCPST